MAARRVQATALLLLALAFCANAASSGGYYYGTRRLSEAGFGFGRQLTSYYYGGHRRLSAANYYYGSRRLQSVGSPVFVRPLFGNSFMPSAHSSGAADIPIPHFLSRQLQSTKSKGSYYYGSRRLMSVAKGGYYYGSHRRLSSYYYGKH